VKLHSIAIKNFRCYEELNLELGGDSLVLVGANSSGKSSILAAVRLALQGGEVSREDLRDLEEPIELIATLSEIPASSHGLFAEAIDFNPTPPVLRVGLQALWDEEERELRMTHGFPDDGWRQVSRAAREAIPLIELPSWRDPARLLALVGNRSILATLIDELPLHDDLEQAVEAIAAAGEELAAADELQALLSEGREQLAGVLPGIAENAFALGREENDPREALRRLRLLLALGSSHLALGNQSGGLGQASIFAFLLHRIAGVPNSIVLVDEPENALHPQAQRALVSALSDGPAQALLTTHSAAVLDRRDPREIARIARDGGAGADLHRATGLSPSEAEALSRYSTALSAEAYFAETVILLEGYSDLLAVRVLARALDVDLDARGVSLLSLDGADSIVHYLSLFGPAGLGLTLRGLCDADHEETWRARLQDAGIEATERAAMNAVGFQVADADLEEELIDALGTQRVSELIEEENAEQAFTNFAQQAATAGLSLAEQQHDFLHKKNVRWAPVLAADLSAGDVPQPIRDLLEGL
jgi:predicted ATPase